MLKAGKLAAAVVIGVVVSAAPAGAQVKTREVEYSAGGTVLKGFLAWNGDIGGKRPGVLVVHEWWGHNDYARRRATMLADLGYIALAVDMYGDGRTAAHPEDAGKFAGELMKNAEVAKARFMAAYDFLRAQPQTDTGRIAAIGYCMGGGVVLNMARAGVELKGVASFHGSLAANVTADPGGVRAKLLVLHGEADKFVPPEAVEAFRAEMAAAKADLTFIAYPGATHSFTNPDADEFAKKFGMPVAYNADADEKSWGELKRFLADVLR